MNVIPERIIFVSRGITVLEYALRDHECNITITYTEYK